MWFKKKKIESQVVKEIPTCEKCGVFLNLDVKDYPIRRTYCYECWKICLDFSIPMNKYPFVEEWSYIWFHGKENGLEWYKEHRDKLIKKIDKIKKQWELDDKRIQNKTKLKIENWK